MHTSHVLLVLQLARFPPCSDEALWQIRDEDFADELADGITVGSSAVQGQSLSIRGVESFQSGFTQILSNLEVPDCK